MSSFFNIDSPFFNVINKICDIVLLSIVYVLCCIPIITIGPATTALYYSVVKVIRRERGYLFGEYFKSFKANFKSGTFITILLVLAYLILWVDRNYAKSLSEVNANAGFAMMCVFNAIFLILSLTVIYIFPVLSRFTVKGFQLIKTSFFISIRHLPSTMLIAVILLIAGLGIYVVRISFIFVPAVACLLCSFLIERVFKKYMPAPSKTAEEEGTDEWYLE